MEPMAVSPTPFYKSRLFLIFAFVVILILIPLGFYLFKINFLNRPVQSTVLPSPSPTPALLSNPLVTKANQIGYNILWMDPDDTVGRTVFYDKRGNSGNNGIGEQQTKNPDGSLYITHITGMFQEIKDISNSPDKYLILANPQTRKPYELLRIILDPQEASPQSTKPTVPFTQLFVEDLDILADTAGKNGEFLSEFRKFSFDQISTILRNGDAVGTILWPTYTINKKALTIAEDESGNNIVWKLYIRRFGGKAQIEKELKP